MIRRILLIIVILSSGCFAQETDGSSSGIFGESSEKEKLTVVLSFDYEVCTDEELQAVLELIEKHNATATFFVMGKTAETNPKGVSMIYGRNYSIGLHTYYHNFPVFREEDVPEVASGYNGSHEHIWNRSFKTKEAFYADLLSNQRTVKEATGNRTTPVMFRAPSLVVNWTRDPAYFEVLKSAGIKIDSSIYQDFKNPRASYDIGGVKEVPVTASDFDYKRIIVLNKIAADSSRSGVPMVFFFHPHNIKGEKLEALDDFLHGLESTYDLKYVRIEDV